MSIFNEMYPLHEVETHRDFHELERMLSESIERGFVREIPVTRRASLQRHCDSFERWFVEYESGEIYSLKSPGEGPAEGRKQWVPTNCLCH